MQAGVPIKDWKEWMANSLTGSWGRIAYQASPWGTKSLMPRAISTVFGPQFRDVNQASQQSEYRRMEDVIRPQIDKLRAEIAKKQYPGLTKDYAAWNKIWSPEIMQLTQYLKMAGMSVGANQKEVAPLG